MFKSTPSSSSSSAAGCIWRLFLCLPSSSPPAPGPLSIGKDAQVCHYHFCIFSLLGLLHFRVFLYFCMFVILSFFNFLYFAFLNLCFFFFNFVFLNIIKYSIPKSLSWLIPHIQYERITRYYGHQRRKGKACQWWWMGPDRLWPKTFLSVCHYCCDIQYTTPILTSSDYQINHESLCTP